MSAFASGLAGHEGGGHGGCGREIGCHLRGRETRGDEEAGRGTGHGAWKEQGREASEGRTES